MINKIKSILGKKCLFCGKINDENSFKVEATVPGFIDKKIKYFCSPECLENWEKYVKEHNKNNRCSSCCCCGR